MKIQLQENFIPISSQDIAAFEQQIGYTLPDEYRQFLLKTNGGKPHCDLIKTPDGELFYTHFFMGLAPEQTVLYNLPTEIDERFIGPDWLLPIVVCEDGSNYSAPPCQDSKSCNFNSLV